MKQPVPFGKYVLLERVNVGGMAEVFKAKAFGVEGFERLVAVKRILPSIAEDQEFITMFIDEAKIAVQLNHANIASIFDLGRVADSHFIAMEFVRGKDMRAVFDRLSQQGRGVPIPMACYATMKVCEGLDYAHNKRDGTGAPLGLVHRDVSPQNILVSYDGEIKIIDFGVAKAANKAGKTQAGILKGKFGYMSPEQVRGLPIDRRSDIFAVGICLYEFLTGERLFVGESDYSTLEKVRNVDIMTPSTYNHHIPKELEDIVMKALAKDVEERYQSAMELHDDLQSFMYTSGNFFARKDLGAWMKKNWFEEIQREEVRDEQFRRMELPQPGGSRSVPPPVPRVSGAPPPPPPPPRAAPANRSSLLGNAPPPSLEMDWDEEELATQIYGKSISDPPMAPPPSQSPSLLPRVGSGDFAPIQDANTNIQTAGTGAPSPFSAPVANPTPLSVNPAPATHEETAVTRQRQNERKRAIWPWAIGALVLLAAALIVFFLMRDGDPGTVTLTTNPPDARVYVDQEQQNLGASPFALTLPPGPHLIEVQRDGYESWVSRVEVVSGQTMPLPTVELVQSEAESGTGFMLITDPPGATIYIAGGRREGVTPLQVDDLEPGTHVVRAELDGFEPWQEEVEVVAGQTPEVNVRFTAAEVRLRIDSEPAGDVVLTRGNETRRLGGTPINEMVDVSGDEWTVEISRSRYETWRRPLRVAHGQTEVEFDAELEREGRVVATVMRNTGGSIRMGGAASTNTGMTIGGTTTVMMTASGRGTVSIQSRPWSRVFIDGQPVGNTPVLNHPLSAGRHQLRLENTDQNLSRTRSFTVRAGENTRITERFQ